MDKQIIKEKIKKILLESQEIIFAYLYGSFLEREDYKDIDIAIFVDREKVKDFFDYETSLS